MRQKWHVVVDVLDVYEYVYEFNFSSLYCMNDSPFDANWPELDIPLGRNWDLDEQCVKDFGEGFRLCSRVSVFLC